MFLRTGSLGTANLHRACTGHGGLQLVAAAPCLVRPVAVAAAVVLTRCKATSHPLPDGSPPTTRRRRNSSKSLQDSCGPGSSDAGSLLVNPGPTDGTGSCSTANSSNSSDNSGAAEEPSYTIHECMQMVAAHSMFLAAHGQGSTNSTPAQQQHQLQQQAVTTLQQHDKPGDCWLFVRCGSWDGHPPGISSAALAVLQVWHVEEGKGDYTLWQLGSDCMPNGQPYFC